MGKAEKYSKILNIVRWFFCVPAVIMYATTQLSFGRPLAFILSIAFGVTFYVICSRGRMVIVSEEIVKDIKETLKVFGHENSVYEVKGFTFGLVVRVYLIRAYAKAPACSKAIAKKLSEGWYHNMLWMTQIADVTQEAQIGMTQKELDDELLKDAKKREKQINKKNK